MGSWQAFTIDRRWHLNGLAPLTDFANGHCYFGFHRTETGWGSYQAILSTDDWEYGGQSRVSHEQVYHSADTDFGQGFQIYLPCRCCVVLRRVGD